MNPMHKIKFNALRKKAESFLIQRESGQAGDKQKEIEAHLELAEFYDAHVYDEDLPYAAEKALECYRMMSMLGDARGFYLTGKTLFDKARFWEEFRKSHYGCNIHEHYASELYKEAFAYLAQAEEHGFALARRCHGLAYIRGWGMSADKDKGMQLIIESIEQEKAWDRAKEIVEELGLNAPEFFAALATRSR